MQFLRFNLLLANVRRPMKQAAPRGNANILGGAHPACLPARYGGFRIPLEQLSIPVDQEIFYPPASFVVVPSEPVPNGGATAVSQPRVKGAACQDHRLDLPDVRHEPVVHPLDVLGVAGQVAFEQHLFVEDAHDQICRRDQGN